MTLVAIDIVLRKLQSTTDIGSYNALFYELITLLSKEDFAEDIKRYNKLFSDSILPGTFNYNLHVEQRIYFDYFCKLQKELQYKFAYLITNTTNKKHAAARERNAEYLTTCHNLIISACSTLFDPECYRIQLRYFDGSVYSVPLRTNGTNFPSLNYEHYIYRKRSDGSYYATKLDLLQGEHMSGPVVKDRGFTDLYNYLYPETRI